MKTSTTNNTQKATSTVSYDPFVNIVVSISDFIKIAMSFFRELMPIFVALALCFDRHVLKRYFNIETPLYKAWWKRHSAKMQVRLDRVHKYSFYV
jgi:hypothetical protein